MTPLEQHKCECRACRWALDHRSGVTCKIGRKLLNQENAEQHAKGIVASIKQEAAINTVVELFES